MLCCSLTSTRTTHPHNLLNYKFTVTNSNMLGTWPLFQDAELQEVCQVPMCSNIHLPLWGSVILQHETTKHTLSQWIWIFCKFPFVPQEGKAAGFKYIIQSWYLWVGTQVSGPMQPSTNASKSIWYVLSGGMLVRYHLSLKIWENNKVQRTSLPQGLQVYESQSHQSQVGHLSDQPRIRQMQVEGSPDFEDCWYCCVMVICYVQCICMLCLN